MKSLETLLELFRRNGLKITPQRRAILELLVGNASHPTADEIYQRMLAVMPDVSRATIYNVLHELIALGVLAEVHDLSGVALRYDTNPGSHHHLFCLRCHALIDIDRTFEDLDLSAEEAAGYRVIRHQVTFYGICPACLRLEVGSGRQASEGGEVE